MHSFSNTMPFAVLAIDLPAGPRGRCLFAKRTGLGGCALITTRTRPDGSIELQLETTASANVLTAASLADWLEPKLAGVKIVAGYKLQASLAALAQKANPTRHPQILQIANGVGADCIDLVQLNILGQPRSLAAACRRSGVTVLQPEPGLVKIHAPHLQRLHSDNLTNAAAASWRLYLANRAAPGEQSQGISEAIDTMDIWLAECAARDLSRFRWRRNCDQTD